MKFRSSIHKGNLYGYTFRAGETVEVKEGNLCNKFMTYPFMEVIDNGVQEGEKEGQGTRQETVLSRDEIKAELAARGIKFSSRSRTQTLRALLDGHTD